MLSVCVQEKGFNQAGLDPNLCKLLQLLLKVLFTPSETQQLVPSPPVRCDGDDHYDVCKAKIRSVCKGHGYEQVGSLVETL